METQKQGVFRYESVRKPFILNNGPHAFSVFFAPRSKESDTPSFQSPPRRRKGGRHIFQGGYGSTSTPRQKATYPLIFRAAGFGSG